eukprot:CAMPEP_0197436904 /NCGR_PEP_ID=MMETSP1175-20131217/4246_1 /TAXON_ID=1003142 /ORGANISM="Triceratium dubium, Strain CCMP147" /LENGTH=1610 /DNA_ID=CAMNT_0042966295 /DNA_START=87 /DNA_END=4919 /DNA_ORIENTATION=+
MSSTERGEPSSQSPPAKTSLTSLMPPSYPVPSGALSQERKRPRLRGKATSPLPDPPPSLLDCIPGAVFKMVVHGRSASISYISDYCESMFNMTSSQIRANSNALFSLIHLSDRQSFQESLVESMSSLQTWEWKGRMVIRPQGDVVETEVRYMHFRSNQPPTRIGDDGAATEWCGIILDVTREEMDRIRWRRSESHAHDANRGSARMDRPANLQKKSAPGPPPADSAEVKPTSSVPPPDGSTTMSGLRDLLDSAPHPLIGLDTQGHVTEWNRTAERITGYSKSEVLGRVFVNDFVLGACHRDVVRMLDEILHSNDYCHDNKSTAHDDERSLASHSVDDDISQDGASNRTKHGKARKSDPSCEATLQTKDGHRPVHLLLTASALRDMSSPSSDHSRGQIIGAVIIAQDISRQHAALALHRSETEKGIMEWLSHEVRNPLSVAVEASRTLKEDPSDDPEENSNNLELICLSLGYIVELLTDMLDLNKCIEGKITMNPAPCRMREDILLPTKRMLDQRRKCVDLLIDDGTEIVANLDRLRLQQVLTNLIVNSMKYTSVGFIRVSMRVIRKGELGLKHLECATGQQIRWDVPGHIWRENDENDANTNLLQDKTRAVSFNLFGEGGDKAPSVIEHSQRNGEWGQPRPKRRRYQIGQGDEERSPTLNNGDSIAGVLITVSDSGSGIDSTNYPNLFERWERLGSKTNGTGIGLCLCRSLMEVMGGRIFLSKDYDSGLGDECHGCRFGIILPPSVLELPPGTCTMCGSRDEHELQTQGSGLPQTVAGDGVMSVGAEQQIGGESTATDGIGAGVGAIVCRICASSEPTAANSTMTMEVEEPSNEPVGGGYGNSCPPNILSAEGRNMSGAASSAAVAAAMEEAAASTFAMNASDFGHLRRHSSVDLPPAVTQERFSIFGPASGYTQSNVSHPLMQAGLSKINGGGLTKWSGGDETNVSSVRNSEPTGVKDKPTASSTQSKAETDVGSMPPVNPSTREKAMVSQVADLAGKTGDTDQATTTAGVSQTKVATAPSGKLPAAPTVQRPAASRAAATSSDPFQNTCLRGRFRVLVVDDDGTFRKMFCRRITRIFPNSIVDQSPSGEDALVKAKENTYDLITMDHFMALDGLNGADTIRLLRSNHCDACIVGISGNTKTAHHLEAGADDFIRKPVPKDSELLRRLVSKMSPPAVWNVLVADDCALNLKFMHRKLVSVSSPHRTSKKDAERRWNFTLKKNGEDSVKALKEQSYDLVVLDQHMGPGLKGTDVADFVRSGSKNPDAIVVINSGEELKLVPTSHPSTSASLSTSPGKTTTPSFNFQWTKPAPAIDAIRQDLCLELVREKSPSAAAFPRLARKNSLQVADPNAGDDASSTAGPGTRRANVPKCQKPLVASAGADTPDDASSAIGFARSDVAARPAGNDGTSSIDDAYRAVNSHETSAKSNGPGGSTLCASTAGKMNKRKLPKESVVLQKLFDELGDEKTFEDMCRLFIANTPAQLDSIDQLIECGDWVRLSAVLHTLKGTLQVFHLDWNGLIVPMYELCVNLRDRLQSSANVCTADKGAEMKEVQNQSGNQNGNAVSGNSASFTASKEEVNRMRKHAAQQRLVLGQVIGVCQGVLSGRDCD